MNSTDSLDIPIGGGGKGLDVSSKRRSENDGGIGNLMMSSKLNASKSGSSGLSRTLVGRRSGGDLGGGQAGQKSAQLSAFRAAAGSTALGEKANLYRSTDMGEGGGIVGSMMMGVVRKSGHLSDSLRKSISPMGIEASLSSTVLRNAARDAAREGGSRDSMSPHSGHSGRVRESMSGRHSSAGGRDSVISPGHSPGSRSSRSVKFQDNYRGGGRDSMGRHSEPLGKDHKKSEVTARREDLEFLAKSAASALQDHQENRNKPVPRFAMRMSDAAAFQKISLSDDESDDGGNSRPIKKKESASKDSFRLKSNVEGDESEDVKTAASNSPKSKMVKKAKSRSKMVEKYPGPTNQPSGNSGGRQFAGGKDGSGGGGNPNARKDRRGLSRSARMNGGGASRARRMDGGVSRGKRSVTTVMHAQQAMANMRHQQMFDMQNQRAHREEALQRGDTGKQPGDADGWNRQQQGVEDDDMSLFGKSSMGPKVRKGSVEGGTPGPSKGAPVPKKRTSMKPFLVEFGETQNSAQNNLEVKNISSALGMEQKNSSLGTPSIAIEQKGSPVKSEGTIRGVDRSASPSSTNAWKSRKGGAPGGLTGSTRKTIKMGDSRVVFTGTSTDGESRASDAGMSTVELEVMSRMRDSRQLFKTSVKKVGKVAALASSISTTKKAVDAAAEAFADFEFDDRNPKEPPLKRFRRVVRKIIMAMRFVGVKNDLAQENARIKLFKSVLHTSKIGYRKAQMTVSRSENTQEATQMTPEQKRKHEEEMELQRKEEAERKKRLFNDRPIERLAFRLVHQETMQIKADRKRMKQEQKDREEADRKKRKEETRKWAATRRGKSPGPNASPKSNVSPKSGASPSCGPSPKSLIPKPGDEADDETSGASGGLNTDRSGHGTILSGSAIGTMGTTMNQTMDGGRCVTTMNNTTSQFIHGTQNTAESILTQSGRSNECFRKAKKKSAKAFDEEKKRSLEISDNVNEADMTHIDGKWSDLNTDGKEYDTDGNADNIAKDNIDITDSIGLSGPHGIQFAGDESIALDIVGADSVALGGDMNTIVWGGESDRKSEADPMRQGKTAKHNAFQSQDRLYAASRASLEPLEDDHEYGIANDGEEGDNGPQEDQGGGGVDYKGLDSSQLDFGGNKKRKSGSQEWGGSQDLNWSSDFPNRNDCFEQVMRSRNGQTEAGGSFWGGLASGFVSQKPIGDFGDESLRELPKTPPETYFNSSTTRFGKTQLRYHKTANNLIEPHQDVTKQHALKPPQVTLPQVVSSAFNEPFLAAPEYSRINRLRESTKHLTKVIADQDQEILDEINRVYREEQRRKRRWRRLSSGSREAAEAAFKASQPASDENSLYQMKVQPSTDWAKDFYQDLDIFERKLERSRDMYEIRDIIGYTRARMPHSDLYNLTDDLLERAIKQGVRTFSELKRIRKPKIWKKKISPVARGGSISPGAMPGSDGGARASGGAVSVRESGVASAVSGATASSSLMPPTPGGGGLLKTPGGGASKFKAAAAMGKTLFALPSSPSSVVAAATSMMAGGGGLGAFAGKVSIGGVPTTPAAGLISKSGMLGTELDDDDDDVSVVEAEEDFDETFTLGDVDREREERLIQELIDNTGPNKKGQPETINFNTKKHICTPTVASSMRPGKFREDEDHSHSSFAGHHSSMVSHGHSSMVSHHGSSMVDRHSTLAGIFKGAKGSIAPLKGKEGIYGGSAYGGSHAGSTYGSNTGTYGNNALVPASNYGSNQGNYGDVNTTLLPTPLAGAKAKKQIMFSEDISTKSSTLSVSSTVQSHPQTMGQQPTRVMS